MFINVGSIATENPIIRIDVNRFDTEELFGKKYTLIEFKYRNIILKEQHKPDSGQNDSMESFEHMFD